MVFLLHDRNEEVKYEAVQAPANLACNDDNQVAIFEAGGIEPLVPLLRHGGARAKFEAVRALANLAWESNASQVAIAAAGGIASLVVLLRDGREGAKSQAARALSNLAWKSCQMHQAHPASQPQQKQQPA